MLNFKPARQEVPAMIVELQNSQITIPEEILLKFGLSEGDRLDISVKDGGILMMPVALYPEGYIEELKEETANVKAKIASGEQPLFCSVDALCKKL